VCFRSLTVAAEWLMADQPSRLGGDVSKRLSRRAGIKRVIRTGGDLHLTALHLTNRRAEITLHLSTGILSSRSKVQ
jgi:hypothetical protein